MKDLNIKPDTLNLMGENLGNSPEHKSKGDDFMKRILAVQGLRSTINKRPHGAENLL